MVWSGNRHRPGRTGIRLPKSSHEVREQNRGKYSPEQEDKIIGFWAECLARTQNLASAQTQLLSSLSLLSCYVKSIGEREERLLIAVAPHANEHFRAYEFLSELKRLVHISPAETNRVFGKMIETYSPTLDYEQAIVTIIRTLANRSDTRSDALRYANRLAPQLPTMVNLYRELTDR